MSGEDEHWAQRVAEYFAARPPAQPFHAVPYDAVRGISWRIFDGAGNHVAIVFEEPAAMLLVQRLNQ
jgi:hypothetical protein